ncbi:hypothetical protein EJ04DRAFT_524020 [Polyplosphaeria fusca]|uniref:Uncharacterized protein n=1 Tax=Polyplosphaeria fusca TaxID=682080 RepID=A0A9P4QZG6_9PLEO|nr:hypothetical protein EJ04DRAFT_524020 [Polyplosphaeria fusca]
MSIQHRSLANVWQHLQGRRDTANILREIIGQQSLSLSLQNDDSQGLERSIQPIIWIKTIYDLERCYLSGIATGVSECPPYVLSCLLPPELLFSSILHLIKTKTRLFPSETALQTREFTRPRHILAQTLLSGLRLVLLRKESIAAHDKRRLQAAINAAWQNDRLHDVERFVVLEVFTAVLDSLNGPARKNAYIQDWANARLPMYTSGLYPLEIRPETFVPSLIHGTSEEDWIDAYWAIFDVMWAVESAITQRCIDTRRQTGAFASDQIEADADEILEQLDQTRTSLLISIFHITGPMEASSALLGSLATTLLDWNEDLDNFLLRQDSLLHRRSLTRPKPSRLQSYGRNIHELSLYYESAFKALAEWLSSRQSEYQQLSVRRDGLTSNYMQDMVKDWVRIMSSPDADTQSLDLNGPLLPIYIVDCPKLHAIPKTLLEYKLRWTDKWAYSSMKENSPIVYWKEGVQCPSCGGDDKIRRARLIEPFQHLATALDNFQPDEHSLSQHSQVNSSSWYEANSISATESDSAGTGVQSQPHQISVFVQATGPKGLQQPPDYTESPISPNTSPLVVQRSQGSEYVDFPVSPLSESLNVPIPIASRLSVELPIPVRTPSVTIPETILDNSSTSALSEVSSLYLNSPSTESMTSSSSPGKAKTSSRTVRIANSMRRRPTSKAKEAFPLPKDPCFVFSASGHTLLLWGNGANHLIRFDIPSNDLAAIQGCKYEIAGIETSAAGNHKVAVIAASRLQKRRLVIFDGMTLTPEHETELEVSGRLGDWCLAVSRNDKLVAISMSDNIQIYEIEDDGIRLVSFHHQIHAHELRGGVSLQRTIPIGRPKSEESDHAPQRIETGWFGTQGKGLSSIEAAEEHQRQSAIVSRKLYFSTDSKRLVVATQLGDHCVYVDVWDCTREPVSTISEHSRSFKMPPWTLNDGDLTSVFYDSMRRNAIVTAFLGKEYPLLIPFPGYESLQNETYSTKVVHAAQSPSGLTIVVANAMTEIIYFEYTSKGALSARKLKKSSSKISNSVFKPGAIALAMPLENNLQCFWIKDGKCMLRTVNIGPTETFQDYDIRPHYDRLMSLTTKPIIAKAPSLMIPELEAGNMGFTFDR